MSFQFELGPPIALLGCGCRGLLFSAFAETLARVIHLLRGLFDALQRIGAGFITASEGLKVTFWGSESYMKP